MREFDQSVLTLDTPATSPVDGQRLAVEGHREGWRQSKMTREEPDVSTHGRAGATNTGRKARSEQEQQLRDHPLLRRFAE